MKKLFYLSLIALLSSNVFAHDEVQNKAVKERMQAMQVMASNMKKLRAISKGNQAFDKSEARAVAGQIAAKASTVVTLFKEEETDPNTKAKPEIWFDYEDFSARAERLEQVALEQSKTISDLQDVKPAMFEVGKICKSCHELYKQ